MCVWSSFKGVFYWFWFENLPTSSFYYSLRSALWSLLLEKKFSKWGSHIGIPASKESLLEIAYSQAPPQTYWYKNSVFVKKKICILTSFSSNSDAHQRLELLIQSLLNKNNNCCWSSPKPRKALPRIKVVVPVASTWVSFSVYLFCLCQLSWFL